jgi:hypothetical protein
MSASHSRNALPRIVSKTAVNAPGEELMILSTSAVGKFAVKLCDIGFLPGRR